MSEIRPFNRGRLHDLFERNQLAYTTSPDGTCYVQFGESYDQQPPLIVSLPPAESTTLTMRLFLPSMYPADTVPLLLARINRWHSDHCWPRAYVTFDDPDDPDGSDVRIFADNHVNLEAGVHDELLDQLFWSTVSSADEMLTELHLAAQVECVTAHVPTAQELASWLEHG